MKELQCDVLVIGGALAGLIAALEARKLGQRVVVICKSRSGHSGNTIVSGSGLCVMNPDNDSGDSPELFEADILKSGAGLCDSDFVRRFVEGSEFVLPLLQSYGVRFATENKKLKVQKIGGHSARRSYPTETSHLLYLNRGLSLTVPLYEKARADGVVFYDECTVYRILVADGRAYGVDAFFNVSGEDLRFYSNSVIIAAGGGASLYDHHNNTADVGCDSYGLAFEAGAELRDMEFVQFHPTEMYQPAKMVIGSPLFGEGAVLRNSLGEAFMERYDPKGNLATRDKMSQAIQREIMEGRGTPEYVRVDCSAIPHDVLERRFAEMVRMIRRSGRDLEKDGALVAPAAHFYIGGIVVDSQCCTAVEGLFACGEARGGLHGANRLARTALPEAVVTGQIAGESAAALSHDFLSVPEFKGQSWIMKNGAESAESLTRQLQRELWNNASLIRTEKGLLKSHSVLNALKEQSQELKTLSVWERRQSLKLHFMLMTAEMLLSAALLRKESRGAHLRDDYPDRDEKFRGSFVCRRNSAAGLDIRFVENS